MSWLQNLKLLDGQIPLGGNSEGIYKYSAGESWASDANRLAAWEHGTGMNHITPAPITYPLTQVGYNAMHAM